MNGIIKGSYYGTITDQISITCRGGEDGKAKTKLRAVLDYKDEVGCDVLYRSGENVLMDIVVDWTTPIRA